MKDWDDANEIACSTMRQQTSQTDAGVARTGDTAAVGRLASQPAVALLVVLVTVVRRSTDAKRYLRQSPSSTPLGIAMFELNNVHRAACRERRALRVVLCECREGTGAGVADTQQHSQGSCARARCASEGVFVIHLASR